MADTQDTTKEYTVTKYAGPKVAGQQVKQGEVLHLTETQARAELAGGTIVLGKKDGNKNFDDDPWAGSKKLDKIQTNANPQEPPPPAEPTKS